MERVVPHSIHLVTREQMYCSWHKDQIMLKKQMQYSRKRNTYYDYYIIRLIVYILYYQHMWYIDEYLLSVHIACSQTLVDR